MTGREHEQEADLADRGSAVAPAAWHHAGGGIPVEDVIVEVLDKVGGWVRADELERQLARRGVTLAHDELFEVALELEAGGRLRSTLYFQAAAP